MYDIGDVTWYMGRRIDVSPERVPGAVATLAAPRGRVRCAGARARLAAELCHHPARRSRSAPLVSMEGILRPRGRAAIRVSIDVHEWSNESSELGVCPRGRSYQWWTPGRADRYFEAAHDVLAVLGRRLERTAEFPPEHRAAS